MSQQPPMSAFGAAAPAPAANRAPAANNRRSRSHSPMSDEGMAQLMNVTYMAFWMGRIHEFLRDQSAFCLRIPPEKFWVPSRSLANRPTVPFEEELIADRQALNVAPMIYAMGLTQRRAASNSQTSSQASSSSLSQSGTNAGQRAQAASQKLQVAVFRFVKILGYGGLGVAALFETTDIFGLTHKIVAKVTLDPRQSSMRDEKHNHQLLGPCLHILRQLQASWYDPVSLAQEAERARIDAQDDILLLEFMKNGDLRGVLKKLGHHRVKLCNRLLWIIFRCLFKASVAMGWPGEQTFTAPGQILISEKVEGLETTDPESRRAWLHLDLDPMNVLVGDIVDPDPSAIVTDNHCPEHAVFPIVKASDLGCGMQVNRNSWGQSLTARMPGKWHFKAPEQTTKEWEYINRDIWRRRQLHGLNTPGNYGRWTNLWQVGQIMWCIITQHEPIHPPQLVAYDISGATGTFRMYSYGCALLNSHYLDVDRDLISLVLRSMNHDPTTRPPFWMVEQVIEAKVGLAWPNEEDSDDEMRDLINWLFNEPKFADPPATSGQRLSSQRSNSATAPASTPPVSSAPSSSSPRGPSHGPSNASLPPTLPPPLGPAASPAAPGSRPGKSPTAPTGGSGGGAPVAHKYSGTTAQGSQSDMTMTDIYNASDDANQNLPVGGLMLAGLGSDDSGNRASLAGRSQSQLSYLTPTDDRMPCLPVGTSIPQPPPSMPMPPPPQISPPASWSGSHRSRGGSSNSSSSSSCLGSKKIRSRGRGAVLKPAPPPPEIGRFPGRAGWRSVRIRNVWTSSNAGEGPSRMPGSSSSSSSGGAPLCLPIPAPPPVPLQHQSRQSDSSRSVGSIERKMLAAIALENGNLDLAALATVIAAPQEGEPEQISVEAPREEQKTPQEAQLLSFRQHAQLHSQLPELYRLNQQRPINWCQPASADDTALADFPASASPSPIPLTRVAAHRVQKRFSLSSSSGPMLPLPLAPRDPLHRRDQLAARLRGLPGARNLRAAAGRVAAHPASNPPGLRRSPPVPNPRAAAGAVLQGQERRRRRDALRHLGDRIAGFLGMGRGGRPERDGEGGDRMDLD